jgi:hypothetical protein
MTKAALLAAALRGAGVQAQGVVNDNGYDRNELTRAERIKRGTAINDLLDVGGSPIDWGARSVPGAINREIITPRSNDNRKR